MKKTLLLRYAQVRCIRSGGSRVKEIQTYVFREQKSPTLYSSTLLKIHKLLVAFIVGLGLDILVAVVDIIIIGVEIIVAGIGRMVLFAEIELSWWYTIKNEVNRGRLAM